MPGKSSKKSHPDTSRIDEQKFIESSQEAKARYGRFNLAVVGGTGVGKSSLVNAVFGRDVATVGTGLPVTRGAHYYHDDALGIWDLEGFEIGSATPPAEMLRANLRTIAERPRVEQISVVWYCVLSTADRLTMPDIEMIRELDRAGVPVILVLTKVDWIKNPVTGRRTPPQNVETFLDWLQDPRDPGGTLIDLPIQYAAATSTQDRNGKGTGHGLGDLVERTLELAPEDVKDAFRIAQQFNTGWKRELARPIIAASAAAAAAAAAVPIPVADAVALAPIQLTMMGRIATVYELDLRSMLSTTTLAQLSAQISGQALARSFIKLVPGAGSVVGASVAAAITVAMGEAWMRFCEQVYTGKIDPARISDAWESYVPSLVDVLKVMATRRRPKA